MRVGIHYADFGSADHPSDGATIGSKLVETARIAEAGGLCLFTLMDHGLQMERVGRPEDPMLEGDAAPRLHLSRNASSASRRRSGSACSCGARTAAPSKDAMIGSSRRPCS